MTTYRKAYLAICGAVEYYDVRTHDWFWTVIFGILILFMVFGDDNI